MRRRVAIFVGTLLATALAVGAIVVRRSIDGLGTPDGIEGGAGGGAAPAAIDGDASDAADAAARTGLAARPRAKTAPPTEHEDRLTGRVVDRAGAPVADARVLDVASTILTAFELDDVGHEDLLVADAVTDADGRFTVAARGDTAIHALVVRTSTGAIGCLSGVALGREVTIVVDGGGSIAGTVTDREGRPIDRATVVVDGVLDALHVRYATTTRTDGTYRLDGVPTPTRGSPVEPPAFRSLIEVRADGFAPLLQPGSPTPSSSGEVIARDFVLSRGAIVEGTIADAESKQPVEGARVVLWSDEGVWGGPQPRRFGLDSPGGADVRVVAPPNAVRILAEVRSDAAGAFRFDHVPGRGFHDPVGGRWVTSIGGVTVLASGLAPVSEAIAALDEGARRSLRLEARDSAVIEGRVVTPPTVPCSSVAIEWSPPGADLPPGLFPGLLDPHVGIDGHYRIDGLPVPHAGEGEFVVYACVNTPGASRAGLRQPIYVQVRARARAGEVAVAPDLVFADAPSVRPVNLAMFRVVDEAERPVWGGRVAAEHHGDGYATATDRDGIAALSCPVAEYPGRHTVLVTRDGFAPAVVTVAFDGIAAPASSTVVLRRGHRIAGTVLRADGGPAEGAHLKVASSRRPLASAFDLATGYVLVERKAWRTEPRDPIPAFSVAVTDRSGRFGIADLPEGTYYVRAALGAASEVDDAEEFGVVSGVSADASDVTVILGPRTGPAPGRIVGSVRVAATGAVPHDLHVELRLAGGAALVSETSDHRSYASPSGVAATTELVRPGRFAFDGVPPGTHRVRVVSEGWSVRDVEVVVEAGASAEVPPIELERGVVVHGRARTAPDVLLGTGRCVTLVPVAPRGARGDDVEARTAPLAADGTFDVAGLAPGSWRLGVPPVSNSYAALVTATVLKIPDGVGEVTWEGTLALPGYLDVGIGDERLPQRSGNRLEPTAEQRTFAEGCEVVVLDERGQVVAEQKGNFARGDTSAVNNFPLPPGTYTVRTKVAGEAARDERVTVTAGTWTRVSFGQSSPDAPAPGGGCGKGKCG